MFKIVVVLLLMLASCIGLVVVNTNESALADPVAIKVQGPDTAGNPLGIQPVGGAEPGSTITMLSPHATGSNATQTATLASAAGKFTYITGFDVTAAGATAASVIQVTVTNTVGGTLSYTFVVPAGATAQATPLSVTFNPPLPANAVNTSIVVSMPAAGAGNTNQSVCAYGFQQ